MASDYARVALNASLMRQTREGKSSRSDLQGYQPQMILCWPIIIGSEGSILGPMGLF